MLKRPPKKKTPPSKQRHAANAATIATGRGASAPRYHLNFRLKANTLTADNGAKPALTTRPRNAQPFPKAAPKGNADLPRCERSQPGGRGARRTFFSVARSGKWQASSTLRFSIAQGCRFCKGFFKKRVLFNRKKHGMCENLLTSIDIPPIFLYNKKEQKRSEDSDPWETFKRI
jgi:hypothetical protein